MADDIEYVVDEKHDDPQAVNDYYNESGTTAPTSTATTNSGSQEYDISRQGQGGDVDSDVVDSAMDASDDPRFSALEQEDEAEEVCMHGRH